MKIICINNSFEEKCLTLNKEYDVLAEYGEFYIIIDDKKRENTFLKTRFKNKE